MRIEAPLCSPEMLMSTAVITMAIVMTALWLALN
jgi:hypothetical protein